MPLNLPTIAPQPFVLAPPVPGLAFDRLPLQGITLLAVEDSRFASEALRLLSQRSGARLRRAETLEHAQAHLRVYRPDAVLVDLGLPDGRGEDLIGAMASERERPALLAMSGDPMGEALALAAGADGFLEKPIAGLAAFQRAILALLPDRCSVPLQEGEVTVDRAALHDDLQRAAIAMGAGPDAKERRYLAGFLSGLAQQTKDADLSAASHALHRSAEGVLGLVRMLDDRLAQSAPFRRHDG
ncbi:response regulator [Xinfangfangia sp. CPCC 101601]|uniref:Response regulator n=1 Tax=Pseudogemmobacter lacusdianii TaxID=3069608 RepID=A0ABU0VT15_9RHOB|nr:response regulator [Xinfangfangia sp. CPCC 101601]MDQ2064808.1 response regulator [Xinfangfangia sp. CPCC 101601]